MCIWDILLICIIWGCVGFLGIVLFIAVFGDWIERNSHLIFLLSNKTMPRLPFKKFKMYQDLNPQSWSLGHHSAWKHDRGKSYQVTFSLIDHKKYRHFVKSRERNHLKNAIQRERNEATVGLLKAVQRDIDMVRKQSDREIVEAKETVLNCIEVIR